MESLGGFVDPSLSTPRPGTPASAPDSTRSPTASSSAPSTSVSSTASTSTPSSTLDLDKEVQNVLAGFGSFWGKVRKQSTQALANAEKQFESTRKDLNPLLSKAKQNLDTFSTAARAEVQRLSEVSSTPAEGTSNQGVIVGADGLPMMIATEPSDFKQDKGKQVDRGDSTAASENPAAAASAFFSRIQHQLSSVQDQAPRALESLSSNLSHQFQDTVAQLNLKTNTEEYLHKGESWLNEFRTEVSKLAKDAVQIVPPTLSGPAARDLAVEQSDTLDDLSVTKGMTRRDTLLHRLRSDPNLFLIDPALPPPQSSIDSKDAADLRESYATFLSTLPESPSTLIDSELVKSARTEGGDQLEQTRVRVVSDPEMNVDDETFWKRYLFRVYLIDQEEEKRKKVLSVAQAEEDDFSWDMDDEDATGSSPQVAPSSAFEPSPSSIPAAATTPSSARVPGPVTEPSPASSSLVQPEEPDSKPIEQDQASTPTTFQSPRTSSSEETRTSYDFVGERSGNPSVDGREEVAEEAVPESTTGSTTAPSSTDKIQDDDEDDSDWE
ncbi:uncharacterized protein JCM15063_005328 [Sporobolomyces koalae]|uniref:uncharacterized protein n=1 Tax=Sporobolomyces koalae TaxID=500713 RepID=UPI0031827868